jgi:hypothetical protein
VLSAGGAESPSSTTTVLGLAATKSSFGLITDPAAVSKATEYAVELELLDKNPMPALKWTPPKTTHGIDRRRVANPIQARTLLHAVEQQGGGRRPVAFFGCLYYAALRPEEAISLAMHNLSLPTRGWGELHIERAEPYAGKEWTDSGRNRDQRPSSSVHAGRSV